MTKEETLEYCRGWIERIRQNNGQLTDDRTKALKYWRGDSDIVGLIEGRSKVTTTDCFSACERAKPAVLKVFTSGSQVASMKPIRPGALDQESIRDYETILNTMMRRKNSWYMLMNDVIDEALKLKVSIVKLKWHTEEYKDKKEFKQLDPMQLVSILDPQQMQADRIEEVSRIQSKLENAVDMFPDQQFYDATVNVVHEDKYIKYEAVPSEDIGFLVETREIDDAPFIWHRVRYSSWEFAAKFGKDMLDSCRGAFDEITNSIDTERFADLGGTAYFYDDKIDEWTVYECYYRDPDNGEHKFAEVCGSELLTDEDNTYGFYPFEGWTPIKLAHRYVGMSLVDILKDFEEQRTMLLRAIYDNVQQSNYRRYFGDVSRLNLDDYLNNNSTNALIRTMGPPDGVVLPEIKAPLPPEVFQLWQTLDVEKDYASPTPRAFTGVTSSVLNDTFRGQAQQMGMASERINMMIRLFGEMFLVPLIKKSLLCLDKFLDDKTAIRYLGHPMPKVKIHDLIWSVDAGIGTGDKQERIMYAQQLLGLQAQLSKSGTGIITPDDVYNTYTMLIRAMELVNVDDYSTDPKWTQMVQQLLMTLGQMATQMGMQVPPQVKQMIAQIAVGIGMNPAQIFPPAPVAPPGGGMPPQLGNGGTFPGQRPPEVPFQPAQPMNPTLPSQGGYMG